MKIIVPKHVEAWMFDMWVDLGPFRLKMRQMFLVALGVAITFWIAQSLMKNEYEKYLLLSLQVQDYS